MIPITLGAEPSLLTENSEAWGREYSSALQSKDPLPKRYQNTAVKDALRDETHSKCAYCESQIEHISYAHIEHILPKSIKPLLVCEWENLTLACQKCNMYKGNYYLAAAPLLNPYKDEVLQELGFFGPMALDRSARAKLTIEKLKLNRPELLFRRKEALSNIVLIMDLIVACKGNVALREALKEQLSDKLNKKAEYTSCTKGFTESEGPVRGIDCTVPDLMDRMNPP